MYGSTRARDDRLLGSPTYDEWLKARQEVQTTPAPHASKPTVNRNGLH